MLIETVSPIQVLPSHCIYDQWSRIIYDQYTIPMFSLQQGKVPIFANTLDEKVFSSVLFKWYCYLVFSYIFLFTLPSILYL